MYNKKILDNKALVQVLKNKNMTIKNENEVFLFLEQINYSKLKEYLYYFDKDNKDFKNKNFKDIIELYEFDKILRKEIGACIEILEVYIKNNIIKILGAKDPFEYLDKNKFYTGFNHNSFMLEVDNIILKNKNSSPLMKTFFCKYKDEKRLPIWIIIEFLTFGQIGKLYDAMLRKDKIQFAHLFNKDLKFTSLNSWIKNLVILRNFCYHNNRIWNRNFKPLAEIPDNINNRSVFAEIYIIHQLLKFLGKDHELKRLKRKSKIFFKKYPDLMKSFGLNNLKDLDIL